MQIMPSCDSAGGNMSWFKGVHVKWREMSCALYGGAGLLPTRQVRSTHSAECYVEEFQ